VSAVEHPRTVLAAFGAVALLAAAGLPRLEVESDSLAFLAPEHPVRRELAALEAAGLGGAAAHLVIELPRGADGGFGDPGRVARLGEVAERLRRHPLVLGAVSAADVAADSGLRPSFVGADPRRARVILMIPMAGAAALGDLFATARAAGTAAFPEGDAFVTGSYPLVLRAQRELLATMLVTLGVAVLLVAAALRVLAGSTVLAWRVLLPNLWPVLVAVGVMGWARVPLDSSTVAVAAVALGLVVDDTLHTFADFRRRAAGRGPRRAVVAALTVNAPAHVATALLLAGGFALVGLCGFVPAARFGALTAVAVAAALAGDLLLLPALLASAPRPRGAPSGGAALRPQDPGAPGEQRQHQEDETERGEGGDLQHRQALSQPVAAAAGEIALLDGERAGPGVGGGAVEAGLA
jgi:predicted RND superfamily exporter protein